MKTVLIEKTNIYTINNLINICSINEFLDFHKSVNAYVSRLNFFDDYVSPLNFFDLECLSDIIKKYHLFGSNMPMFYFNNRAKTVSTIRFGDLNQFNLYLENKKAQCPYCRIIYHNTIKYNVDSKEFPMWYGVRIAIIY